MNINKTIYDANIMIGGELIGMEAPSLKCDIVKISSSDNSEINCHFYNLLLSYDGNNYQLEDLSGKAIGLPINGELKYNKNQKSGNISSIMIDFIQFEYEKTLVETCVLAVLPRINEIIALTFPRAAEKLPIVGNA